MARFTGKKAKETPGLNMGSMSDIIFMLLFFFMVITTMRESSLFVKVQPPQGTEVVKLEKKSLVSYINVGVPTKDYQAKYGTQPRIQLNDQISDISDIYTFVELERAARDEADRPYITTAIKADRGREVKMGLISDIKQELRQAGAFKIFYNASKGKAVE
ncbi:MAG: biopolymer transporter ExbD [Bacteroidales bacterium]|nr:biopolymer transporter ExbD [Bacteroidales bacterium]